MIKFVAFLLSLIFSDFVFSGDVAINVAGEIYLIDQKTIFYSGDINLKNFEKLKGIYDASNKKPGLLKINSNGGEVIAGIQMGNWLLDHNFSVEVIDYCFSSCANYIFPSGKYKYLNKNSVLFWHGSAFSQRIEDVVENEKEEDGQLRREYLKKSQDMEIEFYTKVGVDKNIPWYGNSESCYNKFRQEDFSGFFYSLDDMNRMGLKNIKVKGFFNSWKPIAKIQASKNLFRVNAVRGAECNMDYVLGASILLGKNTIRNAMDAAAIANVEQIQNGSYAQLKEVIFDPQKNTLVFVKNLINPINPNDKSLHLEEKNRLLYECKHSKKIPFQFESFIFKHSEIMNTWHRYMNNGKIIHEIEIVKSECI